MFQRTFANLTLLFYNLKQNVKKGAVLSCLQKFDDFYDYFYGYLMNTCGAEQTVVVSIFVIESLNHRYLIEVDCSSAQFMSAKL